MEEIGKINLKDIARVKTILAENKKYRVRQMHFDFLITKPSEIYHFQIKLPRNVKRVLAIDYDVFMKDGLIIEDEVVLNPSLGRIKLQSMEGSHVFYSDWINALDFQQSINVESTYPFKADTWQYKTEPKKVRVQSKTTIIKGIYEDRLIKILNKPFTYQIKIDIWFQTQEESNGVEFGFLKS